MSNEFGHGEYENDVEHGPVDSDENAVAAGTYKAKINGHALTARKDGSERYQVEFRIEEGRFAGELVRFDGGFGTDPMIDFVISQLRAMGWTGRNFAEVQLNLEEVYTIVVKHNRHKGKLYVEATVRTGGVERYALEPQTAKSFAAKMAAKVAAYDAQSGAAPARRTQAAPTPQQRQAAPQDPRGFTPQQRDQSRPAYRNDAPRGSQRNPAPAGGDGPQADMREDEIPF
mgnify:CR=1 FL=1